MPSNITHMLICHKAIERMTMLRPNDKAVAADLISFAYYLEDKCTAAELVKLAYKEKKKATIEKLLQLAADFKGKFIITKLLQYSKKIKSTDAALSTRLIKYANALETVHKTQKSRQDLRPYLNLGSLGPDLFCYKSGLAAAQSFFAEGHFGAAGVEPWSYHLHSVKPNEFPLKLIEILFRDVCRTSSRVPTFEHQDRAKMSFIAGYLTHIAADQIIHPVVNDIAKPYYRDGKNRVEHRTCEVFQDYFLYQAVYEDEGNLYDGKHEFFDQYFGNWCDCVKGYTFENTTDWFRSMIQRGFVETYGSFPTNDDIEDSVDGIVRVLSVCNSTFGPFSTPYEEARKAWETRNSPSSKYNDYFETPGYLQLYREAVELATTYLLAAYEAWAVLKAGKNFDSFANDRFTSVVSSADLGTPLITSSILNSAITNFNVSPTPQEARPPLNSNTGVKLLNTKAIAKLSKMTDLT